jgi:hypothetical protein
MVLMDEGDGIVSWPGSLNGHVGTWGIKIHSRLSRSPGRPVPKFYFRGAFLECGGDFGNTSQEASRKESKREFKLKPNRSHAKHTLAQR